MDTRTIVVEGGRSIVHEEQQPETERATLAGGCFWCVEAALQELEGVQSVTSGYAGGHTEDPSYEAVCRGETGHAEVVQVAFDPEVIPYADLLEVFFHVHDPTTIDRQGPDVGSQYRSAIFTHDDRQERVAEETVEALESIGAYDDPMVTDIEPLETFSPAAERHQNYFRKHPTDAYCRTHAAPKVESVRKAFRELTTD